MYAAYLYASKFQIIFCNILRSGKARIKGRLNSYVNSNDKDNGKKLLDHSNDRHLTRKDGEIIAKCN
jgi:cytochrome oxidase Cu insertion factor (SCO1/SenC/PrrC family)